MRCLSALMQAAGRAARALFRARPCGRRDGADHLGPVVGLLRRSDREEAAQPFPARHAGAVVRHRRLQPRLQVLPELGHLQEPRDRPAQPTAPRPRRSPRRPSDWAAGRVAFTYNDPVIFHEYAIDVARACRARGVKTVAVTAGYIAPEPRAEFFAHMDAANVDLKGFTEDFYQGSAAASSSRCWKRSRYLVHETTGLVEITTLLIPGENDSDARNRRPGGWVASSSARTCRCISPPSIPTIACWTRRRRRRRRWPVPRRIALACGVRYAMSAMCTMSGGNRPSAINAARCSSNGIGINWGSGGSMRGDAACHAARNVRGYSNGPPGDWGRRSACR